MTKHIVYEIWCPLTDTCIYVGKGNTKKWTRKSGHLMEARRIVEGKPVRNPFKARVLAAILAVGEEPIFKIVAEFEIEREALDEEIRLIAHYGRRDKNLGTLTNLTDGGEGTSGRAHTEEAKQKIREFRLQFDITDAMKFRMKEGQKGRARPTPEAVEKLAAFNRGKKRRPETIRSGYTHSPETLEKIRMGVSKALKGKPKSAEHVANQAASRRGKPMPPDKVRRGFKLSEEQKQGISERMSVIHKGKPKSPEQRAKMSIASKAAHARRAALKTTSVSKG